MARTITALKLGDIQEQWRYEYRERLQKIGNTEDRANRGVAWIYATDQMVSFISDSLREIIGDREALVFARTFMDWLERHSAPNIPDRVTGEGIAYMRREVLHQYKAHMKNMGVDEIPPQTEADLMKIFGS